MGFIGGANIREVALKVEGYVDRLEKRETIEVISHLNQ